MLPGMSRAAIKRCTECRRWFEPAPSARDHQRVCGEERCRDARRRKLARQRRAEALREHRADERDRQRRCRAKRAQGGCHAPPSDGNSPDLLTEIGQIVDGALALSRATLRRQLPRIYARSKPSTWTEATPPERMSRAPLEL